MGYEYMLDLGHRIPSDTIKNQVVSAIGYLQPNIISAIELNNVRVFFGNNSDDTKSYVGAWTDVDIAGIYANDVKKIGLNLDTSVKDVTIYHEFFHAYDYTSPLYTRYSSMEEFNNIYKTEKSLVDFPSNETYYTQSSVEFYAQVFALYTRYTAYGNPDDGDMIIAIFGNAPKTLEYIKKVLGANKPVLINMLEDVKYNSIKRIDLVTPEESGTNNYGIKYTYVNGNYVAFNIPNTGGAGNENTDSSNIVWDNDKNFSTSHSEFESGKITYSVVDNVYLLKTYKITSNQYNITQHRIKLHTDTADSSKIPTDSIEVRFFDYNGTRAWSPWRNIDNSMLIPKTHYISSNTNVSMDCSKYQFITLNKDISVNLPTLNSSEAIELHLILNVTTVGVVTFPSSGLKWLGGTQPTFEAGKVYDITFLSINGSWLCKSEAYI